MEIRKAMRIARRASLVDFHPQRFAGRYRRTLCGPDGSRFTTHAYQKPNSCNRDFFRGLLR